MGGKSLQKIFPLFLILFSVLSFQAKAGELKPGTEFQDCEDCPVMVVIPKGENMLGDRPYDNEFKTTVKNPLRKFVVEENFAMSKFEITRKLFNICVLDGACEGEKHPVIVFEKDGKQYRHVAIDDPGKTEVFPIPVSWLDAKKYADWLSKKTGRKYRLASGDEWEYAARGGTKTIYWWGDEFKFDHEYCRDCVVYKIENRRLSRGTYMPAGFFKENPFGLFDMLGNLKEWVDGCRLIKIREIDGTDPSNCRFRMTVGGGYYLSKKYSRPRKPALADVQNKNIKAAIRLVVEIN